MKESLTSYIRLQKLIKEALSNPTKKKDCNCGCGGCGDKQHSSRSLTESEEKIMDKLNNNKL